MLSLKIYYFSSIFILYSTFSFFYCFFNFFLPSNFAPFFLSFLFSTILDLLFIRTKLMKIDLDLGLAFLACRKGLYSTTIINPKNPIYSVRRRCESTWRFINLLALNCCKYQIELKNSINWTNTEIQVWCQKS